MLYLQNVSLYHFSKKNALNNNSSTVRAFFSYSQFVLNSLQRLCFNSTLFHSVILIFWVFSIVEFTKSELCSLTFECQYQTISVFTCSVLVALNNIYFDLCICTCYAVRTLIYRHYRDWLFYFPKYNKWLACFARITKFQRQENLYMDILFALIIYNLMRQ